MSTSEPPRCRDCGDGKKDRELTLWMSHKVEHLLLCRRAQQEARVSGPVGIRGVTEGSREMSSVGEPGGPRKGSEGRQRRRGPQGARREPRERGRDRIQGRRRGRWCRQVPQGEACR